MWFTNTEVLKNQIEDLKKFFLKQVFNCCWKSKYRFYLLALTDARREDADFIC